MKVWVGGGMVSVRSLIFIMGMQAPSLGIRVIDFECDGLTTRPAVEQGRYVEYKAPCVVAKAFENPLRSRPGHRAPPSNVFKLS